MPHPVLRGLGLNRSARFGLGFRLRLRGRGLRRCGDGDRQGERAAQVLGQGAGDVLAELGLQHPLGVLVGCGDERVALADHDWLDQLQTQALAVIEIGYV